MSSSPTYSGVSVGRMKYDNAADDWGWTAGPHDASAWQKPLLDDHPLTIDELKMREQQLHVDHVYDMVPFWIRGVEAAKKGEVLKLEDFLESLHADKWSCRGNTAWEDLGPTAIGGGWQTPLEGGEGMEWGNHSPTSGWAICEPKVWSSGGGNKKANRRRGGNRRRGTPKKVSGKDAAYALVDDVAKQESMDDNRRRKMHSFFEMSTDDKMKKIDEVITALRSISHD